MKHITTIAMIMTLILALSCESPTDGDETEVLTGRSSVRIYNRDNVIYEIYTDAAVWGIINASEDETDYQSRSITFKDEWTVKKNRTMLLPLRETHTVDIRRTVSGSEIIYAAVEIVVQINQNFDYDYTIVNGKFKSGDFYDW